MIGDHPHEQYTDEKIKIVAEKLDFIANNLIKRIEILEGEIEDLKAQVRHNGKRTEVIEDSINR